MSIDVYQPCPCGSGKKLKFCCLDIMNEMAKVQRLHENQQYRLALQALDSLEKSHPGNPWVANVRASILVEEQRPDEATAVLGRMLEKHPKHPLGTVLYATARFSAEGLDGAKNAVYRAFQRCTPAYPGLVSGLAIGVAAWMLDRNRVLAARAHLVLAMRVAPEQERAGVFERLLEFDGNGHLPYPLRSVHILSPYPCDDASREIAERARKLADIGCWGPAAQLFSQLAEKDPESGALWKNIGFCRAWDGDEAGAAVALHRAAALERDFADAVELETIAQLLEQNSTEDRVETQTHEYPVQSASRLLTRLDQADRLAKLRTSPESPELPPATSSMYHVLDRPLDPTLGHDDVTPTTVPKILGQVTVFDSMGDEVPARAVITALDGEESRLARETFEEAAGDLIDAASVRTETASEGLSIPREQLRLNTRAYLPPTIKPETHSRLERQHWDELASEVWPGISQAALGGKTPREAAGQPELKLALTAALYAFDTFCQLGDFELDLAAMAESLHIELPPPIEPTESTVLNAFSSMRLHRLVVADLNDAQLSSALNRSLLLRHSRFFYDVLMEVLKRPTCMEKVDLTRVYSTLADLARSRHSKAEALDWTLKGKEHSRTQKDGFEETFRWEVRELTLRLQDPDDPELVPFLLRMREYYRLKLPRFEQYLESILDIYDVTPPWDSGEGVVASALDAPGSVGGLWTPGNAEQTSGGGGEKKLWLPGQQ
ncbi:MAG: tetratricopeptide repeat protein [Planctomycetaceae bacterium]